MQRDTIIEKLNRALSEPITTEAQVVYILVLVRKLLGPTTKTDKYERLRFSCDWTVHTELNGPAARRIVKLFDDQVIARGAPLPTGASAIQEYFGKICGPFDILSGFKEKFEEFLDQRTRMSELKYAQAVGQVVDIANRDQLSWSARHRVSVAVARTADDPCAGAGDCQRRAGVLVDIGRRH
jgi:hypothetical protein